MKTIDTCRLVCVNLSPQIKSNRRTKKSSYHKSRGHGSLSAHSLLIGTWRVRKLHFRLKHRTFLSGEYPSLKRPMSCGHVSIICLWFCLPFGPKNCQKTGCCRWRFLRISTHLVSKFGIHGVFGPLASADSLAVRSGCWRSNGNHWKLVLRKP